MRFLPCALLASTIASTAAAQEPAIDLAEAHRAFESAAIASDLDAGRLWGREMYGPVFVVDPDSRFVAADRADPEGLLQPRDDVWVGSLPESINPANSAIDWSGAGQFAALPLCVWVTTSPRPPGGPRSGPGGYHARSKPPPRQGWTFHARSERGLPCWPMRRESTVPSWGPMV